MDHHRRGRLPVAVLLGLALVTGCADPSTVAPESRGSMPEPSSVLLPADGAEPAEPEELLPAPGEVGESWRVTESAPAAAAGCSRAGSMLPLPDEAVRRVLTDGSAYADVSAWLSSDAEAAAIADAVRTGAYAPPQPPCALTPRVVDFSMGPAEEPGAGLEDDRADEPLVRVEQVGADEQVVETEFLLAVQRGPLVAVAVLHGGGPFTQHDAAFAIHRAAIKGACSAVAQPGCEGPAGAGSGLLAPEVLGTGWSAGWPGMADRPHSSLFCNGVGGYGWSGPIEHARRSFTGPGGSTAFQGVLAGVDEETSASLREAAADRGAHTARGCAETPERTEQMLVDQVGEQADTWERMMRVTETLDSGESATALLVGVGRGPVVGLLTARDDGSPVDAEALLAALRTGVCAVPAATGC